MSHVCRAHSEAHSLENIYQAYVKITDQHVAKKIVFEQHKIHEREFKAWQQLHEAMKHGNVDSFILSYRGLGPVAQFPVIFESTQPYFTFLEQLRLLLHLYQKRKTFSVLRDITKSSWTKTFHTLFSHKYIPDVKSWPTSVKRTFSKIIEDETGFWVHQKSFSYITAQLFLAHSLSILHLLNPKDDSFLQFDLLNHFNLKKNWSLLEWMSLIEFSHNILYPLVETRNVQKSFSAESDGKQQIIQKTIDIFNTRSPTYSVVLNLIKKGYPLSELSFVRFNNVQTKLFFLSSHLLGRCK